MSKSIRAFGRRLWEAVRRGPRGTLLPAWRETYGETPAVAFEDLIQLYLKDYAAKAAVDFLADQAVGAGFYTTVNEDYAQAEKAKAVVDEFCEAVNLDGLLQIGAREVVACGNSFWEKITPDGLENLKILPLTSIEKVLRDPLGQVRGFKQTAAYGGKTLAPESIIHFCWNPVNGEPFGTGLLRSLLESVSFNGETRESLFRAKAKMEKFMPDIFEKYAGPDELWIFEGISDDKLAEYQRVIKSKPKAGARFVYNKPADIKTVQVDPRARFEGYIDHLINQFYLGLQTPLPKLFTTPGFTEASATAALELAERKVFSLQRFVARIVEKEIFVPVVREAGLIAEKAKVRVVWGLPETPEIVVADILKAFELRVIRDEEVRKNLTKIAKWELWEKEPEQTEEIGVEKRSEISF